jgi:hypothetical protein
MSPILRSLVIFLLLITPVRAGAGDFLAGFDDLPVMPGLTAVDGAGIVFDTPAGRIIEGYAEGAVTKTSVRQFYDKTLPQLGWTRIGGSEFRREGEHLKIDFKGKDRALTVRFTLSPEKGARRGG